MARGRDRSGGSRAAARGALLALALATAACGGMETAVGTEDSDVFTTGTQALTVSGGGADALLLALLAPALQNPATTTSGTATPAAPATASVAPASSKPANPGGYSPVGDSSPDPIPAKPASVSGTSQPQPR